MKQTEITALFTALRTTLDLTTNARIEILANRDDEVHMLAITRSDGVDEKGKPVITYNYVLDAANIQGVGSDVTEVLVKHKTEASKREAEIARFTTTTL